MASPLVRVEGLQVLAGQDEQVVEPGDEGGDEEIAVVGHAMSPAPM